MDGSEDFILAFLKKFQKKKQSRNVECFLSHFYVRQNQFGKKKVQSRIFAK